MVKFNISVIASIHLLIRQLTYRSFEHKVRFELTKCWFCKPEPWTTWRLVQLNWAYSQNRTDGLYRFADGWLTTHPCMQGDPFRNGTPDLPLFCPIEAIIGLRILKYGNHNLWYNEFCPPNRIRTCTPLLALASKASMSPVPSPGVLSIYMYEQS